MIGSIASDLVTQIKTVSALGNRVGLVVGGTEIDPINRNITLPAVWVIFVGDEAVSDTQFNKSQSIKLNFVVKVLMDYSNESDLVDTQFTLLEDVIKAVRGGIPSVGAKNWRYNGQTLDEMTPERLVWDQSYSTQINI